MSIELEGNGLLGMDPPGESANDLADNGLLAGFQDDGLQGNGLLAMMEDDQMLLEIESGMGSLERREENGGRTTSPPPEASFSTPFEADDLDSATMNMPGPSKQRKSYLHVSRDDTALRNAQALTLPRLFASTADGKYISFGRKVRRKWDGVAVSLAGKTESERH